MTTTFETAQVGDRVYHYKYGWSTITNIKKESNYPIIINYDFSFTYEGFSDKSDKNQSLFWDEVIITPPPKPLPKLEVDTKVLVWNFEGKLVKKRYFSHFDDNNNIHVFVQGATSWSQDLTARYSNWELAKE